MAAGQHNPSRRALLGAAVALPLMGVGEIARPPATDFDHGRSPSLSPAKAGEEAAWTGALDAYEAAEADVQDAVGWPAEYEDEYGERLDSLCDSLKRLWRTPAPDLHALALKIDLAIEHELGTLAGGATCLAAIQSDAHRLCSGQAPRLAAAYPGL